MASTVPRARVANWPDEQVQKGIQTRSAVKYRDPGTNLQLHRLAPTAGRLLSDLAGTRRAQAAIRGLETSLGAPLTLGKIRWYVTIENPSLRQVAVAIPISWDFQRSHLLLPADEYNCCLSLERIEPSPPNLSNGLTSLASRRYLSNSLLESRNVN
jgi:hypothetical protein